MNNPIRTDLAIENAEMFQERENLQGVSIHEGGRQKIRHPDNPGPGRK